MGQPESSELVVFKNCGDPAEAAILRALLDAHGISCVVQGEQHRSMLGVMGGYIEVNVLVAAADLERAQAVVQEAEAGAATEGPAGRTSPAMPDTEDAVCPVHGERSTAACSRCGTFLCARCDVQEAQSGPVCEDCAERKVAGGETRRSTRRRLAGWLVLFILFGPVLIMMIATLLGRLIG